MNRHIIVAAILLTAALSSGTEAVGAADFTGTWKLDPAKGSSGYPNTVRVVLAITHTGETMSVARTFSGMEFGDGTINETYVVNGQRVSFSVRVPTGQTATGHRTSRWAKDGRTLEVVEDADNESPAGALKISSESTWSLSDDGKTLTVVINSRSPFGDRQLTQVFRKQ